MLVEVSSLLSFNKLPFHPDIGESVYRPVLNADRLLLSDQKLYAGGGVQLRPGEDFEQALVLSFRCRHAFATLFLRFCHNIRKLKEL